MNDEIGIAKTPPTPYYAVIFTSLRTEIEDDYSRVALRMVELAQAQEGYLGHESARNDIGITVSYWASLEAIKKWKQVSEHVMAQKEGRQNWYAVYKVRICKVERDYDYEMR
jgi:heme-degrading monooxygenase HmoA